MSLAQAILNLNNSDLSVKGLIKPLTPLADGYKTYEIVSRIEQDPNITSIDQNRVQTAFQFYHFEKANSGADLRLIVTIKHFERDAELKTRKDSSKQVLYWFEERIRPQIHVVLADNSGKLLFEENGGLSSIYKTPERRNERAARLDFNNRFQDAVYPSKIAGAYRASLDHWSKMLKNNVDYQPDLVSIYFPKGSDPAFLQTVEATKKALMMLNQGVTQVEVLATLEPSLKFYAQELENPQNKSGKKKYRYYASALNMANIYRSLENFEEASHYIRLLINDGYQACEPLAAHLAEVKERDKVYRYYKKTGRNIQTDQKSLANARLDSLSKQNDSEGYVILNNNQVVKGSVLKVLENFNNFKVVLKYQKKLNAPVSDIEYSLVDVNEIHLDRWHLAIVPYKTLWTGTKFYLTEILFQSPEITLCRTLPGMGMAIPQSKETRDVEFLRKRGEKKFTVYGDNFLFNSFDSYLSKRLKDCPVVSRQAKYGYYTPNQILEAVLDYDKACGTRGSVDTSSGKTVKNRLSPGNEARSPGFYLGYSTGLNSFTSLLGITSTVRLHNKLFARLGAGAGFWGPKFAVGIKYDLRRDMRYRKGWSFAFGYARSLGVQQPVSVGTYTSSGSSTLKVEVDIRESAVNTLSTSLIYNKFKGRKKAFFLEMGYAASLQKKPWTIVAGNNGAEGAKTAIKLLQPGGIILGLGYNFGL